MINTPILDTISDPADVRQLDLVTLQQLTAEIRAFLIESISQTGGHIGTALGVVELTCAIHHTFDLNQDKLLFDTGHQGYTHKLLTGRKALFPSLNQPGGMSRFLTPKESAHDLMEASHAGTAIAIATGLALASTTTEQQAIVIAIVGDGALVEGMSMEGLNFAPHRELPLMIILNDNGMAIPVNVGGIKQLTSGEDWQKKSQQYFSGLGYHYLAIADGHDLPALLAGLQQAHQQAAHGPVLVHVKTEKGHGLAIAQNHPYKLHFSMPFDPETGAGSQPVPAGKSFATVSGDKLVELFLKYPELYAITPSTPYASGLDRCLTEFPARTIDVGMAEQQAAGLAAGLALAGKRPFIFYQATFMQRAYDQLMHDLCYMRLPVTVFAVRSGFAGYDSATHHGIYDISYLRSLPGMQIFYAGTSQDLLQIMADRADRSKGPMIVLYPYEAIPEDEARFWQQPLVLEQDHLIQHGSRGIILSMGNTLETGATLQTELQTRGSDFGLAHIRWVKPLRQQQLLGWLQQLDYVITTEENIAVNGFGASIAALIMEHDLSCKLFMAAIAEDFVAPGDKADLMLQSGIDSNSILENIRTKWPELEL